MKPWLKTESVLPAYLAGGLLLILSVLAGLSLGATSLGLSEILEALRAGDLNAPALRILRYVRLPRVWGGVICGAALSVSGAVIQGALHNRLASPSIIGVNAGAGLAVTIASALGILGGWRLSLIAFLGALAVVIPISLGAKRWGATGGTVILLGVAVNSLLGAVSETVVTLAPDVGVMTTHFKAGDLSGATEAVLVPATVLILSAILLLMTLANTMEVLSLGDDTARGLGVRTGLARGVLLLLAALLAGAAVSVCGLLSFVGLLIPHGVRRGLGRFGARRSGHHIPLCALFGGGFVTLCDTLSRVLFAPFEVPVGILLAFVGAPFFVFILIRGKGGDRHA
jgi:iron complex transport system permease protein